MSASDVAGGLEKLERAADVLYNWHARPWEETRQAARAVGPLMHALLTAHDIWERTPAHDRAAVCWAMADGHIVGSIEDGVRHPEVEERRIRELAGTAEHVARMCGGSLRSARPQTPVCRPQRCAVR